MKIITTTGTKGKSTVVRVISGVLQNITEHPILHVDTHGWYVNNEQKGTLDDSRNTWGLVPTVSPGRFIYAIKDSAPHCDAVLEVALGSSNLPGLGYKRHDIGIFTNVLEDHLGSSKRLKTRHDIAMAKKFIFQRTNHFGTIVFNADDENVVNMLKFIPSKSQATLLPVSIETPVFNLEKHIESGGHYLTIQDNHIVIIGKDSVEKLVSVHAVTWTFNGAFKPSLYNLGFATAALLGYHETITLPEKTVQAIEASTLDPYGGRLTRLRSKNGVEIIIDYAHEKYSFVEVGKLAKTLTKNGGKVYGVLRIAYDRTEELIDDTAKTISSSYDAFIIYDKIDGYWKMPKEFKVAKRFTQEVGKTSEQFSTALNKYNPNVTRIIREDEALAHAAKVAKPGDVIVHIPNDDLHRSVEFVKKAFEADFI